MAQSMLSSSNLPPPSNPSNTLPGQYTTCLSADHHEHISDTLTHYMGCIEYCDRKKYFHTLEKSGQEEIKHHLRRVDHIREMLLSEPESRYVWRVEKSIKNWRRLNEKNIAETGKWRASKQKTNMHSTDYHDPNSQCNDQATRKFYASKYNADHDINAHIIQYRDGKGITDDGDYFTGMFPNQKLSIHNLLHNPVFNPLSRQCQIKDNRTEGKGEGTDNRNTSIGAADEAETTRGPFQEGEATDGSSTKRTHRSIRYFHLPSNNMKWVQDAIARYYDEYLKTPETQIRTNMLLHHDYWRGQEYGKGSDIMHSRHLRPFCEPVSSEPGQAASSSGNMVVFMPYLHWELDRQREHFTSFVNKASSRQHKMLKARRQRDWQKRHDERKDLHSADQSRDPKLQTCYQRTNDSTATQKGRTMKFLADIGDVFSGLFLSTSRRNWHDMRNGRLIAHDKYKIGQLLYDASVLYRIMDTYRDRKLIDQYLFAEPLHARRTLDQAYHWTLRSTGVRDRDQVLYRETNIHKSNRHRLINKAVNTKERQWECNCPPEEMDSNSDYSSKESTSTTRHKGCPDCQRHIQKEPQVIMVDQLWMWILDDETIITAFPRRYGMSRQDPIDLHKNIRDRLGHIHDNSIYNAYDLAIIILQECSNIFFDHTKADKSKPQILDIFSAAIWNMAQKRTLAFSHLWERAPILVRKGNESLLYRAVLHRWLLDITHEGQLQRETKDIIEELDMIIFITEKQDEVLKRFNKHLRIRPSCSTSPLPVRSVQWNRAQSWASGLSSRADFLDGKNSNGTGNQGSVDVTAGEVLSTIRDHLYKLRLLRQRAESVCQGIDQLLALKQQQASVVQAQQAIQQGEEAVTQGRSIMIFTVITIVFLPLAFMAAIFGMNNDLLKDDNMSFMKQMKLIFGISAAVIVVILLVAFSNFFRVVIWAICYFCTNWILVRTGLYTIWLNIPERFHAQGLVRWTSRTVDEMKQVKIRENSKRNALKHMRAFEEAERDRKIIAESELLVEQEEINKWQMRRQGPPSSTGVTTIAVNGHGG